MDTFMDKLAQRFNAQEMIKANQAAESEEMERLKAQVQEYTECLNRMKEICAEIEQTAESAKNKMESAQFNTDSLKEELLEMWKEAQSGASKESTSAGDQAAANLSGQLTEQLNAMRNAQDAGFVELRSNWGMQLNEVKHELVEQLSTIQDMQTAQRESIMTANDGQLEDIKGIQAQQLESFKGLQAEQTENIRSMQQDQLDSLRSVLKAQLSGIKDNQVDGLKDVIESHNTDLFTRFDELKTNVETQLSGSNEFVHKECVKVYRNVQAVIGEENSKQNENLDYTLKPMGGRVQTVLKISIAALIFSIAGVALQVVNMLGLF